MEADDAALLRVPARDADEIADKGGRGVGEPPSADLIIWVCKRVLEALETNDVVFNRNSDSKERGEEEEEEEEMKDG